jgi:hypothetical protein
MVIKTEGTHLDERILYSEGIDRRCEDQSRRKQTDKHKITLKLKEVD